VLSALVAAAALVIVLAGRGSTHQHSTLRPPTIGIGATRACVRTGAEAQSDDRSSIALTATVEVPVSVTEQASGPRGVVTVTRSDVVKATAAAREPLEVKRTARAKARACANGASTAAAGAAALRIAYADALATAHSRATHEAERSLTALIDRRYHAVLAAAKRKAAARAQQLALAAEATLASKAKAEARRRAGA
jgi:hypothetical protein